MNIVSQSYVLLALRSQKGGSLLVRPVNFPSDKLGILKIVVSDNGLTGATNRNIWGAVSNLGRIGNGAIFHSIALSKVWSHFFCHFSCFSFCFRCRNSMFVDRSDHNDCAILTCPVCYHHWCKTCQQDTPLNGPEHSCDGLKELDNLVKNKGWKRCPGEEYLPPH